MAKSSARRRSPLPRRNLLRDSDGTLRDIAEQRRITIDELRDDLRAGRHFRARSQSNDADCTNEVLSEIMLAGALPTNGIGGGLAGLASMLGAFGKIAEEELDSRDRDRYGGDGNGRRRRRREDYQEGRE